MQPKHPARRAARAIDGPIEPPELSQVRRIDMAQQDMTNWMVDACSALHVSQRRTTNPSRGSPLGVRGGACVPADISDPVASPPLQRMLRRMEDERNGAATPSIAAESSSHAAGSSHAAPSQASMVEGRKGRTRRRLSERLHVMWERLSARSSRSSRCSRPSNHWRGEDASDDGSSKSRDDVSRNSTSCECGESSAPPSRSGGPRFAALEPACTTPFCDQKFFGPLLEEPLPASPQPRSAHSPPLCGGPQSPSSLPPSPPGASTGLPGGATSAAPPPRLSGARRLPRGATRRWPPLVALPAAYPASCAPSLGPHALPPRPAGTIWSYRAGTQTT